MIKNMVKILCLGNEFVIEDSLAKRVGKILGKKGYDIVNVKDSFEIVDYVQKKEPFIILDVVENLKEVKLLSVDDLKESKVISAHDFDSGFFIQLMKPRVKIIGLPQVGNVEEILRQVQSHLTFRK